MQPSELIRGIFGVVLTATVLSVCDAPARVAALLAGQAHSLAAAADEDDGGSDSDSDGGSDDDSGSDASDDRDAGDMDDGEDDRPEAEDDLDEDDLLLPRNGRAERRAGDRDRTSAGSDRQTPDQRRRKPAPAPARAPAPLPRQAAAELLASGLSDAALAELQGRGYRVLRREEVGGRSVVKLAVPRGTSLANARRQIADRAPEAAVDYNSYYRPESGTAAAPCPDGSCYGPELIGWPAPGPEASCGAGLRIGLIDTAINTGHAALGHGHIDVIRLDRDTELPESGRQHGTAVAALLMGAKGSRVPGLLPESRLIAVDAFHSGPARDERAEAYDLVRALDLLADQDVRVINLSLSGPPNLLLEQAIARLNARGIVLVAAAGNHGPRAEPAYPAAYPEVIAVTAIDQDKAVYRRANRGDYVEFAAPGVDVWTAASISGARTKSGTSFAAPFVTAVAAVLAANDPAATPATIRARMAASAEDLGKPGRDAVFGWGLVNARDICPQPALVADHQPSTTATP